MQVQVEDQPSFLPITSSLLSLLERRQSDRPISLHRKRHFAISTDLHAALRAQSKIHGLKMRPPGLAPETQTTLKNQGPVLLPISTPTNVMEPQKPG